MEKKVWKGKGERLNKITKLKESGMAHGWTTKWLKTNKLNHLLICTASIYISVFIHKASPIEGRKRGDKISLVWCD